MTTTLRILGWGAQGLRCPDHEINCRDADDNLFPITLIQMPNGTGKTTTLELIRAALSGVASKDWDRKKIQEMKKKDSDQEKGLFELKLMLDDDKYLTIRMLFDFDLDQIDYKTTWGSGQKNGFHPPPELRRFMNRDFVNFYVFDGELAENLLSHDHTDAENAVESLFQIHLLSRMEKRVSEYWDDRTRNMARDEQGYTRRLNKLSQWRKRRGVLEKEKTKLQKQFLKTENELNRQREKHSKEIKKHEDQAEEISNAENEVKKFENLVQEHTQKLLDEMRDLHALSPVFATSIFEFKTSLDQVRLPESAAREFFKELAEESECICGREIDEAVRDVISARAQQYLGSDDIILLNAMKSAITDAVGQSRDQSSRDLLDSTHHLSELVSNLHDAKNEFDRLNYAAERSDPNIKSAKEEIDRLTEDRLNLENQLKRYEGKDETVKFDRIASIDLDRVFAIETIEEGIQILEERVAEVTRTRTLRQKRDVLKNIIKSAHKKARGTIATEISADTNERIARLMPYNNVRINRIDRCLALRDQSGGSVGETLSVGYAFLSTLFNRADQHELPFVVDSPANPIDLDIRANIGKLVPCLTGQFIAFMISSERERFLDSLREVNKAQIQYLTLFRQSVGHLADEARSHPSCVTTKDGFLVSSENFFDDFQLEQEEA